MAEIIILEQIRRALENEKIKNDMRQALNYLSDFFLEKEKLLSALDTHMTNVEKVVSGNVGEALLSNLGIDAKTAEEVGVNILSARGAFKAARDALQSCHHYMEDASKDLIRAVTEHRQD